ncbi:MAG: TolC family protein [Opitutaceae bacterium]|nr:TolC family protein [Opitutaceae bacterium]
MVWSTIRRHVSGARPVRVIGRLLAALSALALAAAAGEPAADRSGAPPESLSLRRAIQLALANNRNLMKAGLDREVQRFDLRVALDEFLPNLDVASGIRYNPVTTAGTETETRSGTASAVVTQRIPTGARFGLVWDNTATDRSTATAKVYDSSLFLQLDQPLLRGAGLGPNLAGVRIARLAEQNNVLEFQRTVMNTVTGVIFVYRALQQAQRQVEVSESAVTRAREQLRINRALVTSGILPPVEIIQTEADIANQEYNLLTAQATRDSARVALVKVLDVDRDSVFVPSEDIVLPEFALDPSTCRQLAFAHRPDYRQALQSKSISELDAAAARNNQLWALNLSSRYRLTGNDTTYPGAFDSTFSRHDEDWNVGLTLQIPFGDLTRRQAYLRARNRAHKADLDVTEVTENIELEVRDAYRTVELTSRRVRVATVARELAERKLDIEKGKLQVGRTTNFAVVTFQNDLISARLNEIAAQIAYLNSLTLLEQTLGTTLGVWGIRVEDYGDGTGPARAVASTP